MSGSRARQPFYSNNWDVVEDLLAIAVAVALRFT
jgi:hypothetical protein